MRFALCDCAAHDAQGRKSSRRRKTLTTAQTSWGASQRHGVPNSKPVVFTGWSRRTCPLKSGWRKERHPSDSPRHTCRSNDGIRGHESFAVHFGWQSGSANGCTLLFAACACRIQFQQIRQRILARGHSVGSTNGLVQQGVSIFQRVRARILDRCIHGAKVHCMIIGHLSAKRA